MSSLLPLDFDSEDFCKEIEKIKKVPLPTKLAQFKFKVGDKVQYFVIRAEKDGTFYKKTGKIIKCININGKSYYTLFPKPYKVSRFEESLLELV